MRRGAIILCGGNSTRMGVAKAMLPFGPELMLQRVVRLVNEVVEAEDIVVVAAAEQALPELPAGVSVVHDARPDRGPLEAMAAGLRALGERVDAVYITSCDVPLLVPAFVERMFELLVDDTRGAWEIAVPRDGKFHHPLAAVYRTAVLAHVQQLLAADRLRPVYLFETLKTREIDTDELRDVDPTLATLENLNTRDDYLKALTTTGLEAKELKG